MNAVAQTGATKTRILDASERLFARHGYQGTTLRQVSAKAGTNLAAVNYHFKDKQTLYTEVFRRRILLADQSRLAALEETEAKARPSPVSLEEILGIMARPFFESDSALTIQGHPFAELMGRSLIEPISFANPPLHQEITASLARFSQLIRRQIPTLSPEEFLWRFSLAVGALHHVLLTMPRMKALTRGICRDHDGPAALRNWVKFAAAGLTAPASSASLN